MPGIRKSLVFTKKLKFCKQEIYGKKIELELISEKNNKHLFSEILMNEKCTPSFEN